MVMRQQGDEFGNIGLMHILKGCQQQPVLAVQLLADIVQKIGRNGFTEPGQFGFRLLQLWGFAQILNLPLPRYMIDAQAYLP